MTRRRAAVLVAGLLAFTGLPAATANAAEPFPDVIDLPVGFRPEGIATGTGTTFYVGSIPTGRVWVGDYRTGEVGPLVPQQAGRAAIGLKYDRGLLYVAGGPTGKGFVYDAETGADVAVSTFTTSTTTFVNDVVLTKDAAWFTDSRNPVLYRVARNPDGSPGALTTLPLSGDFVQGTGNNANGIAASPDGKTLYIAQSNIGSILAVDPETGVATVVVTDVPNADGILLDGGTLYVVQNRLNLVAEVDLASGTVLSRTGHPKFDVPTTIAEHGDALYAVNARFTNTDPNNATFWITRFTKP